MGKFEMQITYSFQKYIYFWGAIVCRQIYLPHIHNQRLYRSISLWILSEWRFTVVTTTLLPSYIYWRRTFRHVFAPRIYKIFVWRMVLVRYARSANRTWTQHFYRNHSHFSLNIVLRQALLCLRIQWCGTSRKMLFHLCGIRTASCLFFIVLLFNVAYSHKYFHRTAAVWVCFSDSNHNVFSNSRCTKHQVEHMNAMERPSCVR